MIVLFLRYKDHYKMYIDTIRQYDTKQSNNKKKEVYNGKFSTVVTRIVIYKRGMAISEFSKYLDIINKTPKEFKSSLTKQHILSQAHCRIYQEQQSGQL